MFDAAKLATKFRGLLLKQHRVIEAQMDDPNVDAHRKAELAVLAVSIMTALDKTTESYGKLLITKPTGREEDRSTDVDAGQVLREMMKGKK
jgi:hypothetical protein